MFKNILTSAVFAGVAVGALSAVLQLWLITPALVAGELYETGERVHFAVDGSTQSAREMMSIWAEPSRHAMTIGFNMVTFTGFALLLVVGFALAARSGHNVTARQGFIWGLAGFISVQLAPSLGLPPVLPGTVGPDVELRQAWWIGCVIATGVGLALVAFGSGFLTMGVAVALILAPHIVGAPQLDTYFGVTPPELSAQFAARSLGTSALAWSMLGFLAAWLWTRPQET